MFLLIRFAAALFLIAGSALPVASRTTAAPPVAPVHLQFQSLDVQGQPKQQEEFIPVSQLPPEQQLPAAPLLIAAYVFVLAMLFVYVASLTRRLNAIQREVDRLDSDVKQAGRT